MPPCAAHCLAAALVCASVLRCACLVSASAAVTVNPSTGIDNATCGAAPPCKTIAYAVGNLSASIVYLSAGVFDESSISVTSAESLVIIGVPSATVFDCSSRPGPAFNISNSTVSITGVAFQACSNPDATGGAVSASGSSVAVTQCSFVNCSAASGGAMSVSGPGSGLYLSVQNSSFTANSASGGLATCPTDPTQPCSTWGGAVAAFGILNVTVSGCRMGNNTAQAYVPTSAPQYQNLPIFAGGNAVAGGGCVSVVFPGNASGCSVRVIDNAFLQCTVTVAYSNGVVVGNGMPDAFNAARAALRRTIDACAGYGGGVSVYFGLSVGLQLLDVAFFTLALLRNRFTRCTVIVSGVGVGLGGNVYGGGMSVYMGGYSSSFNFFTGSAAAAVGDTAVRNASVLLDAVAFISCRTNNTATVIGNAYGGAFSLYLGGYAWRFSDGSSSTSGSTTASGVLVSVSDVNSSDCSATTTSQRGANSYGGSMSVYIGAYTFSTSQGSSLSSCGTTDISGLVVSISSSRLTNSSAVSRTFSQCPLVSISLT
jgi:hypothetical protein